MLIIILILAIRWYRKRSNKREEEHFRGIGQCSKSCCATEWQSSFLDTKDIAVLGKVGQDYFKSNITCNGSNGAGCVCLNPRAKEFLATHGTFGKLNVENF